VHEIWRKIHRQRQARISKFAGDSLEAISRGLNAVSSMTYTAMLGGILIPFDRDFDLTALVKYKKFTKVFRKTFTSLSEIFVFSVEENSILLEKGCDEMLSVVQQSTCPQGFHEKLSLLIGVLCHTIMANPAYETTLRELYSMRVSDPEQSVSLNGSILQALFGNTVNGVSVSGDSHSGAQQQNQNLEPLRECVGRIIAKAFEIIRIMNETHFGKGDDQATILIELSIVYFLDNFVDATIQGSYSNVAAYSITLGVELVQEGEMLTSSSKLFQYTSRAMGIDGNYYKLLEFILKKMFAPTFLSCMMHPVDSQIWRSDTDVSLSTPFCCSERRL
jgi:hypothetical protein